MARRHIVPVPGASDDDPTVVIEVKQTGSRPLDVRLVGCEGENPYVAAIEHRNIGKLKKHNFKGSDQDWETILSHFLLQQQPEGHGAGILDHVFLVYALKGAELELSIRRDVQGIKVTLGEVTLHQDATEEINPFEWAQLSAQAHTATLKDMAAMRAKVEREQQTISLLNAQLEDFIKTKNEAETAMLQQFMELLNEKKRKIRDQSRLLASAKVDKTTASAVQSAREETRPRKAGPSRASKRKTPAKATEPEPEPDSDQMEIDEAKGDGQDDESGPEAATPDRTTDDETDEGDGEKASDDPSNADLAKGGEETTARRASPPPRRELPFTRRTRPAEKQTTAPVGDDDDDETEDEL